jgi:hypothetical protein
MIRGDSIGFLNLLKWSLVCIAFGLFLSLSSIFLSFLLPSFLFLSLSPSTRRESRLFKTKFGPRGNTTNATFIRQVRYSNQANQAGDGPVCQSLISTL